REQHCGHGVLLAVLRSLARLREISVEPARLFELGGTTTLGRDASCTIVLQDPLTSRMHAEIRRDMNGGFAVFDLGSTHGTFIDAQRVTAAPLKDGMKILRGPTRLRFEAPLRRFGDGPSLLTDVEAHAVARRQATQESFARADAITSEAE